MTATTKEKKRKAAPLGNKYAADHGRPRINIDWQKVDFLLEAGCSGVQVANNIGIHPATLYEKCKSEKGINFAEYCVQKYSKGEAELVAAQYSKAKGLTDLGDNTLLIWLGKTRLKQKEYQDEAIKAEVESAFNQLMQQMEKDKAKTPQDNVERPSSTETA